MRNIIFRICFILLVTAVEAMAQALTPVPLTNPGFEAAYGPVNQRSGVTTITGQIANGWLDNSSQFNPTVQYAQESSNPHSGASCQKIVVANPGSGQPTFNSSPDFQIRSGNIYTATIWMRGTPGVVARFYIRNRSHSANVLESDLDLTANWQQVVASGYVTVTDNAFLVIAIPAAATVWVDDAAISFVPGTLAPTPNLGTIPSSFFGMHVQNFVNNQLWNPGFEPPYGVIGVNNPISGQMAANWRHNISTALTAGVTAVFSQDTANPHSGTSSQKVEIRSGAPPAATEIHQEVALVPGATYTLSAWFRGDSSVNVGMTLVQADPAAAHRYAGTSVRLTPNWRRASVSGQVLAGDAGLTRVSISLSSPGNAWVDDVSLTDANGQPVSGVVPWPAAGFGTLRIWQESRTAWTGLEPAKGQWNWGPLDSIVAAAEAHGVDILLTLGQTPGWASPTPDVVTAYGAGATAPPTNIQDWRDYVAAVAQRYKGRIRYYEIWNEPDGGGDSNFYRGTVNQLATLTQEAYQILKAIDPANTVVSPPPSLQPAFNAASVAYLDRLFVTGIGKYVDILAVHVYTNEDPPEVTALTLATVRLVMAKYKLDKMPLWDSEASSGIDTTPPDVAAKYIARKYLTELAYGSIRYDWYAWDNTTTDAYPATTTNRYGLNAAGRAYRFVYNWLAGSTLTQALVDSGGNWQIRITRPDGSKGLVVWNPTTAGQFTLPGDFTALSSHDLTGAVKSISGRTVNVTDSPVLLTDSVDRPPIISFVNVTGGGPDIAQNTWTEIYGQNLAPANTPGGGVIWGSAPEFAVNRLPTQLGNAPLQVMVNGVPAYMFFYCSAASGCGSDQINVLTPLDGTTGPTQITIDTGIYSASFTVNLRAVSPSFLLYGGKYIVATHIDNTVVGPGTLSAPGFPITPAKIDETIQVYAVGFGLPQGGILSGSAIQSGALPSLPACQIGGAAAVVLFAGSVGPGLYQLNLKIPNGPSGDNPIVCTYNGVSTPQGDLIAIQ